jgi:hypothetical protein
VENKGVLAAERQLEEVREVDEVIEAGEGLFDLVCPATCSSEK